MSLGLAISRSVAEPGLQPRTGKLGWDQVGQGDAQKTAVKEALAPTVVLVQCGRLRASAPLNVGLWAPLASP